MSRGFVGNRGVGGSLKHSAKQMFINKAKGRGEERMSQEDRYTKMMNEKLEEIKTATKKSSRFNVTLPGTEKTSNEREMSKAAQDVIDKLAKERAKKFAKKNQFRNMTIRARHFGGLQPGRIDKKGKIYGPDGRYIAFVCKKTGKVKNRWGNTICKYTDSTYCDFAIARFIAWTYDKKRLKATIYAVHGHSTAGGGVYGSVKDGVHGKSNGGSVWGAPSGGGGGSVWGPSDSGGGGGLWGNGW